MLFFSDSIGLHVCKLDLEQQWTKQIVCIHESWVLGQSWMHPLILQNCNSCRDNCGPAQFFPKSQYCNGLQDWCLECCILAASTLYIDNVSHSEGDQLTVGYTHSTSIFIGILVFQLANVTCTAVYLKGSIWF